MGFKSGRGERIRGLLFSSDAFTICCLGQALGRLGRQGITLELHLVVLTMRGRRETT